METTGPLSSMRKLVDSSSEGPLTTTPVTPPDRTAKTYKNTGKNIKMDCFDKLQLICTLKFLVKAISALHKSVLK
jgi:hypothetical protein